MEELQHWYTVRTKPRREAFAQMELGRRGVETFLPRIIEPGRSEEPSVGPLFPSYLFARLSLQTQYTRVVWAPGVRGFVAFGGAPPSVGDDVIAFLQERCGSEGVVRVVPSFSDGDLVRIKRGPLGGLVGVVQGDDGGRSRVQVLMELLRKRTQVSVPAAMLEHAGAA